MFTIKDKDKVWVGVMLVFALAGAVVILRELAARLHLMG
jgi:hypothetical protein